MVSSTTLEFLRAEDSLCFFTLGHPEVSSESDTHLPLSEDELYE